MCYYELPFTGTQHNFAYMEWYLSNIFFSSKHGSGCTLGKHVGSQPTYVYPESLKAVVREKVPGNLVDQEDPTGPKVM